MSAYGRPVVIPLPRDTPLFTVRVPLDGADFVFGLDYSGREDRWYMSIVDVDGAAVVRGIKLVENWPLLHKVSHINRPKGELMAFDGTGGGPPGLRDLGKGRRVKLLYFPLIVVVGTGTAATGIG